MRAALQIGRSSRSGQSLRAGDMAQVIVRSPFAGRLLFSVETDDVISDAGDRDAGVAHGGADRRSAEAVPAQRLRHRDGHSRRSIRMRPGRRIARSGRCACRSTMADRKLAVRRLICRQTIRPATSLGVDLRVTDASGDPVANAAVTVAAVDEGICQLTGFTTPDPFGYLQRESARWKWGLPICTASSCRRSQGPTA